LSEGIRLYLGPKSCAHHLPKFDLLRKAVEYGGGSVGWVIYLFIFLLALFLKAHASLQNT